VLFDKTVTILCERFWRLRTFHGAILGSLISTTISGTEHVPQ
jgi:hypothetical protein